MAFNATNTIFNQIDTNQDGSLSQSEFANWAGGAGGLGAGAGAGLVGDGYGGSSSYESSASYSSGGYGAGAGLTGGGYGGSSSYESSSLGLSGGYSAGAGAGAGLGVGVGVGGQGFDSSSSSFSSQTVAQTYPIDAQGLFIDSNPQIIRRPAAGGVQTYTQNIKVRFLQPPPVPPPGPLIIKEVRPPQPPAPPPLRIRQQAPSLPQPPPLVLREKPPQPPASAAAQTVIRRLGALPVPPRSVIIERLPPLPPRPRDIIIERWIPYGAQAKRKTIVQRAGAAQQYARPRNIIIIYEAVKVNIVRQFQNLGVTQADPQAYLQQYGAQLLDAQTLLQQARAAGVVEDLSPPAGASGVAVGFGSGAYAQDAGGYSSSSSFESSGSYGVGGAAGLVGGSIGYGGGVQLGGGSVGYASGAGLGGESSSYESSSWSSSGSGGFGGAAGTLEAGLY